MTDPRQPGPEQQREWQQPSGYDPHPQEPPATSRSRKWKIAVIGALSLVLLATGVGIGVLISGGGSESTDSDVAVEDYGTFSDHTPPSAAPAGAPTPEPVPPTPDEFVVDVTVTGQQCFGSAGCLVDFQATPEYVGATAPTSGTFTVIYEITGAEDPIIGSFTADFDTGQLSYDGAQSTDTSSSDAELTATVTEIISG